MTSTTKSDRVRSITGTTGVERAKRPRRALRASALFGAASAASKGPAGVGLLLAKRGYGLARKQAAQRRAATAARIAEANRTRVQLTAPSGSRKTRRILVFGGAAAVVAGVVFFLGRRRNEVPPPADVPPSLNDYEDTSS
ncbi:30S ribosomal protein S2P [Rhodococcus sp. AW25M09]|uniref:hypothetical protein n=1 Tax=Rhodococcus sp. AW25M09 TaxID=1268303 RepID=UPI0002AC292C|nr:hypothetical protein [Rhodococcus sp. AW25M09]CCQ14194.1 30S ribosomal protein S2P [Rhodococcus sp. AW25M09]